MIMHTLDTHDATLPYVAGGKLRRDLMAEGGVAPVIASPAAAAAAAARMGGEQPQVTNFPARV